MNATELQAIIDAQPAPPHGSFEASDSIDDTETKLTLQWVCDKDKIPEEMYGDEPWRDWGGDAIIAAAGLPDSFDTGGDQYQDRYGDLVVSSWVTWAFPAELAE